ncbi:MAG: DUF2336 domain-containing protein [Proteobacteria bacterium]|nr:DUF2336 domain-containing protein [Pseudomonadota bacterium]
MRHDLIRTCDKKINVDALLQMALDRSTAGRSELARSVADICLKDDSGLNEREVQLIFDILYRLINGVEMRVRRDLAQRLASREDVPRDLIVTLANDQIDVAYPVLVGSTLLQDEDLIAITQDKAVSHHIAITLREYVSIAVSDALIDTDNVEVIDSLVRNPAAELSEPTMARLVEMSRDKPPLRRPLLQRPDISPDLAWRMHQWVGDALKKFIDEKYPGGIDQIGDEIDDAVRDAMSAGRATPPPDRSELVADIENSGGISVEILIQTLRDQDVELFEALFARLADIDLLAMPMIVYDPGGEPFAIACKACNVSTRNFEELHRLLAASLSGDSDEESPEFQTIRSFYERLDGNVARRVLNEWRRAPGSAWQVSP